MSSTTPPFVSHCVELLAPLGAVRVCRMFGGWGLYVDEVFLAIIAFERLYLKADRNTQARFEQAQCQPFVYEAQGKTKTVGYWTAPAQALDSPALMEPWARLALQAALSARRATPGRSLKPAAMPKKKPPAKEAAKKARSPT
jgi:DNA transformation protein and related proteins